MESMQESFYKLYPMLLMKVNCIHFPPFFPYSAFHSVGFYRKYGHFCPAFHDKIDESFLRFFSLTLILLKINSPVRSLVWENY